MDVPGCILVERHRLKQNVIAGGLSSDLVRLINDLVNGRSNLESVRVHLLADFALKPLPVE